ncbi:MAG: cysteine hydrolase [Planctomycetaceae bacterium]|jgi:nicotinamidase-related amidase|nr:cysteine hydrolase [Planctomycetaceae bacterium]
MKSSETAVIFIEFQNDFCQEGGKLFELVKPEMIRVQTIENARRLLDAARTKGCSVIHCPFSLDAIWVDHCSICGLIANVRQGECFLPGTWGHRIIDELAPIDGETVLNNKRALSGFTNTYLDEILKQKNTKNVIIAGLLTNVCAQATAWTAYDLGYNVRMAMDACAATSQANHEYVVNEICPILGGKTTVDDLIASLE